MQAPSTFAWHGNWLHHRFVSVRISRDSLEIQNSRSGSMLTTSTRPVS